MIRYLPFVIVQVANFVQVNCGAYSYFRKCVCVCLQRCKSLVVLHIVVSGELAQLGERMAGSHEVTGSNPVFSTIFYDCFQWQPRVIV